MTRPGTAPARGPLPAARALPLAGLVAYAPGAVVSRTIAATGGGTVTAFAFDAGQKLSEHTAPYDALAQVVDGRVELTVGGQRVRAAAGDLVLLPARVPHALAADGPFKMLLVMLREAPRAGAATPPRPARKTARARPH